MRGKLSAACQCGSHYTAGRGRICVESFAMPLFFYCAIILSSCCALRGAETGRTTVFCTPLQRDNRSEESDDYPHEPRPVVLMVKGKFTRPVGQKPLPPEERGRANERIDLHIDEILFGPNPGQVVTFLARGYSHLHQLDKTGYYSFVCVTHNGKLYFDIDNGYFWLRHLEANEPQAAAAIARARLDSAVLGSEAIFIGKPVAPPARKNTAVRPQEKPVEGKTAEELPAEVRGLDLDDTLWEEPPAQAQEVVIERVLHGSLSVGSRASVQISQPLPLRGDGSRLYFVSEVSRDVLNCSTCWDLHFVDQVATALTRQKDYPERDGRREIVFLGNMEEARDLLASRSRFAQGLAERRMELLGGERISALAAAIERNLLASELRVPIGWEHQKNLISQLAETEKHRPDGEIVRLANLLLNRAEAGENFPAPPTPSTDEDEIDAIRRRRLQFHYHLSAGNHSLAWLIETLEPNDAARLFCERLKILRDLTSYGWKEEATGLLEVLHLEDRLALPPLLAEGAKLKPRVWQARWPQPLLAAKKYGPPEKFTRIGGDPFGEGKDPFCTTEEPAQTENLPVASNDPFANDPRYRFAELIGYPFSSDRESFSLKEYPHGVDDFKFVRDGNELLARSQYGSEIVWNATTGREVRTEHGELKKREFWSPHDRIYFHSVATLGNWTIVLREHPYRYKGEGYGPPAAAAIVVTSADREIEHIEAPYNDDEPIPGARGQVRLFGYQEDPPFGLFADEQHFFIGTNIFRCRDLKPISFANVLGEVREIVPAASGRYAVLAQLSNSSSDWVVRIHDVEGGATLFALPVKEDVIHIAFSPSGRQVAAITEKGRVLIWDLP